MVALSHKLCLVFEVPESGISRVGMRKETQGSGTGQGVGQLCPVLVS